MVRRGIFVGLVALSLTFATGGSAAIASSSGKYAPVCSHALPAGVAGCHAIQLLDPAANWQGSHATGPAGKPSKKPGGGGESFPGYYPLELQSAYGLAGAVGPSATKGGTQTVAIVDAYNDPKAEEDLGVYRSRFGLSYSSSLEATLAEQACTEANGCFAKVNQKGEKANYPSGNTSWSEEISLDLDMVSAVCPHCHILLVEANSNTFANLGAAVNEAVALGANAISNSYGGSEFSEETKADAYYDHPGVAVTASSGDGGYGVEYPAASPFVTAVGGTTLKGSIANGWSQTVWSGSGAGCSAVEPNPGWQPSTSLCSRRTVADTSADANPNTGVAVYDNYEEPGWLVFGGTSVASPIVASVYALAENASTFTSANAAQALYGDASLIPIKEGTDLSPRRCGVDYLCSANYSLEEWTDALAAKVTGWYNGPTGNGTPEGVTGF